MRRLLQSRLATVFAAVVMTGVFAAWTRAQFQNGQQARHDRQQVSQMMARTKTVCAGRFLIDLPDDAQVEPTQARIHGLEMAAFNEPLSQDAAAALRDRISSSIRPRPVTPSTQSARKPTPPGREA